LNELRTEFAGLKSNAERAFDIWAGVRKTAFRPTRRQPGKFFFSRRAVGRGYARQFTRRANDPRLYNTRAASGLSETVPSDGGFLIQPELSKEILQAAFEVGKLAKLCRRIQISAMRADQNSGLDETSRAAGSVMAAFAPIGWTKPLRNRPVSRSSGTWSFPSKIGSFMLCHDELLEDATALGLISKKWPPTK